MHTLLMIEGLPAGCPRTLAWGVLLHDVGKPSTFTPPSGPGDRIRFNEHAEIGTRMAEESAVACGFRMTIPTKSLRWWPITCGSRMSCR